MEENDNYEQYKSDCKRFVDISSEEEQMSDRRRDQAQNEQDQLVFDGVYSLVQRNVPLKVLKLSRSENEKQHTYYNESKIDCQMQINLLNAIIIAKKKLSH